MEINYISVLIAISAAMVSGLGTAIIAGFRDNRKEKRRQLEREQDHLKLEIKDLKISLYKLERELNEWKDKYYNAIQELISMLKLSFTDHKIDDLDRVLDREF